MVKTSRHAKHHRRSLTGAFKRLHLKTRSRKHKKSKKDKKGKSKRVKDGSRERRRLLRKIKHEIKKSKRLILKSRRAIAEARNGGGGGYRSCPFSRN